VGLGVSAQHRATQAPLPGIARLSPLSNPRPANPTLRNWTAITLAIPGCINDALGDHF
jgi:hypothetical protein